MCGDFVDDGGRADAGGALVLLVGMEEDVEGYWRRAVEVAVRATFEDEEPIFWESWGLCVFGYFAEANCFHPLRAVRRYDRNTVTPWQ
jgi:hypothetical protein